MRIVIADDEPIARQVLRELLEEIGGVTVEGEAASGGEAIELAARLRPDVLLLDLQMPGLDGFGAARALQGGRGPAIIFVTAFEAHALEAFDAGAVDYLLKPVRRERLEAALEKARARVGPAAAPAAVEVKKVVGRLGETLHLLDPAEVIAFQAEGDVVRIVSTQGKFYSDHSLRALEARLPASFRRIHRATLINTDHIRMISPLTSNRWLVKMTNGLEAVVSKRMAGTIREATRW